MRGWKLHQKGRVWRRKKVHTSWLLLAFLLCAALSIYFLRQNNLKMVELRSAVIAADKTGDGVEATLLALNEHIFSHMNTTTVRPIELVNTYNRQAQRIIEEANKGSGRDVYNEAAKACEQRGVPLTSIAQCAAEYASKNSPSVGPKQINLPDKNRFTYSFASPLWTPDVAGFFVALTGVLAVWLVVRLLEFITLRLLVRKRLKRGF